MNRERTPWGLTAERLVPSALLFPKRWAKNDDDANAFFAMHNKNKNKNENKNKNKNKNKNENKNENKNKNKNKNKNENSSIAAVGISEPVANAEEAAAAAKVFLF